MLITFSGTDSRFLERTFFNDFGTQDDTDVSVATSTRIVAVNSATGYIVDIRGSGFTFDADGPTGGTGTSMTFSLNGVEQGRLTDINWSAVAFVNALDDIEDFADTNEDLAFTPLANLFSSSGTIRVDATGAAAGFDLDLAVGGILERASQPLDFDGSNFADRVFGTPENDTIDGGGGDDTLNILVNRADATAAGTEDNFTLTTAQGTDTLLNMEFVEFNDQTVAVADLLSNPGDLIEGDNGDNTLNGGAADDTVVAGRGDDSINAGAGNDDVRGDGGNDTILGGDGNDTLRGGREVDIIDGGADNDVIRGQSSGDTLTGGDGDDNIKGGGGNDYIDGEAGNDFLKGGSRVDTVMGGDGNDILAGNSFNDTLDGGAGDDRLRAGGDDDRLIGGEGNDFLKSGSGMDTFVFDLGHDRDEVNDLDLANDMLEITAALANGRDAQGIEDLAQVVGPNVEIDFGGGDVIVLQGFDTTEGLAEVISIV